ncbi:GNAT-family N-acetyltransferase, putative [Theileria annulata]|uniref:GNAT-family N-acetyltransferase, putative n=1 Tax=Theileria annulata TaxID=5874 RepID=Q4UAD8_THEAN|nr:GNAT-family N-acetyltransferase, putative [Theileria annulata]CAI76213.1 GNAT-family N-acetyltransferase, putative [Theileria annulata]|eukprot:XP_952838.1 GNAT-family N-acetyltransferase, putative [Theileria annulata]
MIYSRRANIYDLVSLSDCNLVNVIENYQMKYYFYHLLSWPHLTNITINKGFVCGYSMSKLEEDKNKAGHVTAVGVLRSFRNLGIATNVIKQTRKGANSIAMECTSEKISNKIAAVTNFGESDNAMNKVYDCDCSYLYVRVTNWAAYSLYKFLGYFVDEVAKEYFHDKEDAYSMKLIFKKNP